MHVEQRELFEREMRNKQEELETSVCSQISDVIGNSDTWWKESPYWSTETEGYNLFRRDRQGR